MADYPRQSTDPMQSLSNYQEHLSELEHGVVGGSPEVPLGNFAEGRRPAKWTPGSDLTSLAIEPNRTWNLGSQAPTSPGEDRGGMDLLCCAPFSRG